ncbi:MAG: hypothetical protein M1360_01105 [Candidatus Marsarchaeota archaeon]|jgi:hypothetical protein|nr:hypothetical protein [Candidatus Marsarchaeota archaeon]MCL5418520.1 hypothetical protein [Candidatus Marsarchaeota archaeon]
MYKIKERADYGKLTHKQFFFWSSFDLGVGITAWTATTISYLHGALNSINEPQMHLTFQGGATIALAIAAIVYTQAGIFGFLKLASDKFNNRLRNDDNI